MTKFTRCMMYRAIEKIHHPYFRKNLLRNDEEGSKGGPKFPRRNLNRSQKLKMLISKNHWFFFLPCEHSLWIDRGSRGVIWNLSTKQTVQINGGVPMDPIYSLYISLVSKESLILPSQRKVLRATTLEGFPVSFMGLSQDTETLKL